MDTDLADLLDFYGVSSPEELPTYEEIYADAVERYGESMASHMEAGGSFDGGYREYWEDED